MTLRQCVKTCLLPAVMAALPGCGEPGLVGWTDWRGPDRDALSRYVPRRLPARARFLWRRPLSGVALSGIAATSRYVIVADKDEQAARDVWRCLDADTGEEIWSLKYPAAGEMDYSNSPRASPVIHDGLVYLLGAFGDLHCLRLAGGDVVWKTNIVQAFSAELAMWGCCATPLIVDDKLIVNPGAADAAVVALDRRTGAVLWEAPGRPGAYSSFIVGSFGGVRQIVGYDSVSLGGWDVRTGRRLWELLPEIEGDFNVPTPVNVDGKLLLATENNGTRLYGFDAHGRIIPKPLAENLDLTPDASTPVVYNGKVFGCSGGLYCLDLADGLKTLWQAEDDGFDDYASLIAGNGRVLVTSVDGQLLLIDAAAGEYLLASRLRLFEDVEIWSHPALVGNRLYVRNQSAAYCLLLAPPP